MKEADFVWDEDKLIRFIANPDEIVPGNNMKPYGGLVSKDERAKIIAFLLNRNDRSYTTVRCRSMQVWKTSSIGRFHQSFEKISTSE